MLKFITRTTLCAACVWASHWVGVRSGAESKEELTTVEPSSAPEFSSDSSEVSTRVASERDRIIAEGIVYGLDDLASARDPEKRLEILLSLLEGANSEDFGALYYKLAGASRYERNLLLNAWLEKSPEDALKFVKVHDPRGLDFAMEVALKRDPESAEKWADEAGIMTVSLLEFEHQKPSEEEVDQWIQSASEEEEKEEVSVAGTPVPLPEWVKDFPMGESVENTAAEVVKIAATHSERSRYWLANSRNQAARFRAAGDIGWESNDLSMDEFERWLETLPEDLAAAALAGRLERLAAENPEDLDLIHDELDSFSRFYNLDESIYLIGLRLIQSDQGSPSILGELIARIDGVEVRESAEGLASYAYGASMVGDSAVVGFSAAIAFEIPTSGIVWAQTVMDPNLRQRAQLEVAQEWWAQNDPASATQWLEANEAMSARLRMSQSMSESRLGTQADRRQ